MKLLQKKFKPEIKLMIENLRDAFYQLKNKKAKGAKLRANFCWDLEGDKCSKAFFKVLERQNLQNETKSESHADDNRSKYSSNPKDIFKSAKKFYEKLYTKETTSKASLAKLQTERKYLMNNLIFLRRKYL